MKVHLTMDGTTPWCKHPKAGSSPQVGDTTTCEWCLRKLETPAIVEFVVRLLEAGRVEGGLRYAERAMTTAKDNLSRLRAEFMTAEAWHSRLTEIIDEKRPAA